MKKNLSPSTSIPLSVHGFRYFSIFMIDHCFFAKSESFAKSNRKKHCSRKLMDFTSFNFVFIFSFTLSLKFENIFFDLCKKKILHEYFRETRKIHFVSDVYDSLIYCFFLNIKIFILFLFYFKFISCEIMQGIRDIIIDAISLY